MRARDALRREMRAFSRRAPDIFQHDPRRPLIVGYSGGQDSTALLHALAAWRPALDIRAVHIDHALRATSADAADAARRQASALGVQVEVMRVDVAAYRQRLPGFSIQQAARAARYHALGQAASASGGLVVVGHTADDQAETLLMRLLRGSGLDGLGGMRADETMDPCDLGPTPREWPAPSSPFRLARPLLRVPRVTTLVYCAELDLPIVEDASNASSVYTRNRVRHDVLPLLESFNPAIRRVLARTADLIAEDALALETLAAAHEHALVRTTSSDARTYDRLAWLASPRPLQRRMLRRALAALSGDLSDVRAAPIDDALDVLAAGVAGSAYHLPYGITLSVQPGLFSVTTLGPAARPQRPSRKNRGSESSRV